MFETCFAKMLDEPEEPASRASSPEVVLPPIKVATLHPAAAAGTAPLITRARWTAQRRKECSSSWSSRGRYCIWPSELGMSNVSFWTLVASGLWLKAVDFPAV